MSREREGEILLILHSFFESWFPIVSAFSIALIGSIYSYAFTLLFAGLAFLMIMFWRGSFIQLNRRSAYLDLILSTTLITTMFLLIFSGIKYTTAANAAVIIFMQLFFAYLYFNLLGKQPFALKQSLGATLMACGAIILLIPDELSLNRGDLLILAGSSIAPIANLYQKRARAQISSETLLAFRSIVAAPFIFLMAFINEPWNGWDAVRQALPFVLINGLLLMGISKMMWIEAIHRISITKASAMIAFIPLFTMIFAYFTRSEIPTRLDFLGALLIMGGSYWITREVVRIIPQVKSQQKW